MRERILPPDALAAVIATSFAIAHPLPSRLSKEEIFFRWFVSVLIDAVMKDEDPLKRRTRPSKCKFVEVGLFFYRDLYLNLSIFLLV